MCDYKNTVLGAYYLNNNNMSKLTMNRNLFALPAPRVKPIDLKMKFINNHVEVQMKPDQM